jgi:copper oxidase (laccase) domain-containing protein
MNSDNRTTPVYQWPLSQGFFSTFSRPPLLPFFHVHQVHGAECVKIMPNQTSVLEQKADGVFFLYSDWINTKLPTIAVKTADCLPICIIGKHGIGMVHAGWRGIEKKAWMALQLLEPFEAFIGPHICVDHYPVGNEFLDIFPDSKALGARNGKLHLNLGQEAIARLGIDFPGISVRTSQICTFEQMSLHSYRRQPGTGSLYHLWHKHVNIGE